MIEVLNTSLFGITFCILSYLIGVYFSKRIKSPFVNPLIIAEIIIIATLLFAKIPLQYFNLGGDIITALLTPATAFLAVSIYNNIKVLKSNYLPIIIGSFVGSAVSILSILVLCKLFRLDDVMVYSLLPKSVTTAIAMEISESNGGLVPITIIAVMITGIFGTVFAPVLIKLLRIKNPVAQGVAIGTSSHGLGTSKAIEIGEVQGAMSGIAIGISGIITVLIALIIY